jgi:hypothetical protein
MKVKNIGSNQTEITLPDGTQVLISYETPVAAWIDGQFYKTDVKYSATTTKHINKWCHCAVTKPQSFFNNLLRGDK